MRSRNREVSLFNMSALDLFASALGAFILITVVLFPFFPNTGDSEERVVEVKARLAAATTRLAAVLDALAGQDEALAAAQAALAAARQENQDLKESMSDQERWERQNEELQAARAALAQEKRRRTAAEAALAELRKNNEGLWDELQKARFPPLDLVIAVDVTGSMAELLDELKYELSEMVEILTLLAPSLGVGVVGFNDREQTPALRVRDLEEAAPGDPSLARLQGFINTLEAGAALGNNPDYPEAVVLALERAAALSWRRESKKRIIVVITDAPAYYDRIADGLRAAAAFARGPGQSVSGVWAQRQGNRQPAARRFLEELSRYGEGRFVEASGSVTSSILLALLDS